jgi:hypothetical protein
VSPRALAFVVAVACGCIFGSRPQLPDHDEDGGRTGGTAFSDASSPSADVATAMPPDNATDAGSDRPAADAARDAGGGRGCADDAGDAPDASDAPDAGDAPDASDAGDAAAPCHDGGIGARPALDMEVAP